MGDLQLHDCADLLTAAESGDVDSVRRLLDAGAAVDATREDGGAPILLAALVIVLERKH